MKLFIVVLSLFLTACTTKIYVPVPPPEFPTVGDKMWVKCPPLKEARDSDKLSELLDTVILNYGEYHRCKLLVEAWHQWYIEQKNNYERLVDERMHSK